MTMSIIAVANRKGGTGKTTTAVNLAAGFAKLGLKTLLIDMDTQGQASLGCGIPLEKPRYTTHCILRDPSVRFAAALQSTAIAGLDIIIGDRWSTDTPRPTSTSIIRAGLRHPEIQDRYDIVLIDTAPALDGILVNALAASDHVVVPFLPHPLSVDGVRQFARALFLVRLQLNPSLSNFGFLPVQYNSSMRLHRATIESIGKEFGQDKILPPIRSDIKLAEAFSLGKSAQDYAPVSRGTLDYSDLVTTIGSNWLMNSAPARHDH